MVRGYTVHFTSEDGLRGRVAPPQDVVRSSSARVQHATEATIGVKEANIFNLLPVEIFVWLTAMLKSCLKFDKKDKDKGHNL